MRTARPVVERWPAGPKLAGLAFVATMLLLVGEPAVLGVALLAAAVASAVVLGWDGLRVPTGAALAMAAVALFAWTAEGAVPAFAAACRLLALLLLARLVADTTRVGAMQDALVAALQPVERLLPAVSADRVGLALALAIRTVPRIGAAIAELREAQAARGLRPGPLRLMVPLLSRVLRDADAVAEAVDARGWPPPRLTDRR